jgi:hypothetical protein
MKTDSPYRRPRRYCDSFLRQSCDPCGHEKFFFAETLNYLYVLLGPLITIDLKHRAQYRSTYPAPHVVDANRAKSSAASWSSVA